ncbi:hypothetical protein Goarm_021260 [Gossypium armourianum]|uniref:Uncharacterized protein n=1 Tax=Gossypium armourianum TaxID=34283 RepID=A0A7J9ISM1_9ROSI|nr:hypothetical protein [Gossypium armourianum]
MRLRLQWMESPLLPAMNVLSRFADPATSMREERVTKLALSAKPDTNESKAVLGLKVMRKKMA